MKRILSLLAVGALLVACSKGPQLSPLSGNDVVLAFGDSLTFGTGPQGQPWVYKNYIFGRDIGGALTLGRSNWDGKPAWTADFRADFVGVPISVHEYRQLTPVVWISRDTGGTQQNPTAAKHSGGAMAIG